MKLSARRAGLPGKVLSFIWCPLIPPICLPLAGKAGPAGHVPAKGDRLALSWKQLKGILKIGRGEFKTQAEKRFVDDLITYS
jgi:hypothetical protein